MIVINETTYLYEIATALNSNTELKTCLSSTLKILADNLGATNGAITILNPLKEEIKIEVAHGLSQSAILKGRYKPGEGITGQVIGEGRPIIVPRTSKEPKFLDRTGAGSESQEESSFLCHPIKKGNQVVGALSVAIPYSEKTDLDGVMKTLTVISFMLAQKVASLEILKLEKEALAAENQRLQEALGKKYNITNIIGSSSRMREVFQMISQVCDSRATVLIRGESGTGKELVASAIHYSSIRKKSPFVKVNSAALPPTLIESELFGHEKGAFTGAIGRKQGKFELAGTGTIFLDEIGSLGMESQASLLRLLQEKEFERVGGSQTIKSNARVIAATNKDLEKAVEAGDFRSDLYYRLNVFPIYLPPLRERRTDILLLAEHFLEKFAEENQKEILRFSTPAIDMLTEYHWPGNVRELENCIERAVLLCEKKSGVIRSQHLPPTLQTGEYSGTMPVSTLEGAVEALEKELIIDGLKSTRGNMAKAAAMLGLSVRKFTYKAKKYNIDHRGFRVPQAVEE